METAVGLRREAARTDERRALVLAGERERAIERVGGLFDALGVEPAEAAFVGPDDPLDCRSVGYARADRLMGTTQDRKSVV